MRRANQMSSWYPPAAPLPAAPPFVEASAWTKKAQKIFRGALSAANPPSNVLPLFLGRWTPSHGAVSPPPPNTPFIYYV